MGNITDKLTKLLWNKNYPRTLIIFNINNSSEMLAGIAALICYFYFPVEHPSIWGLVACLGLILVPFFGTLTAVLNQEIYEWIVFITHAITAIIIVPLYFCTMGTFYGAGLVMFVLTTVQTYVLIKNIPLKVASIAVQNTIYGFLMIASAAYPQYFLNYAGELKMQMPLFSMGIVAMNVYICFLARIFVYTFKMDYERTVELTNNLATASAMDNLTGAYNEETGLDILQTFMNNAWINNESLSIVIVDVKCSEESVEDNKYLEDLILVNTFDACRAVLSTNSAIVRLENNRFLLILSECKDDYQINSVITEIDSHFSVLMQAAKIEDGSLSFGSANLLHGMSLKGFISSAERNIGLRRSSNES